VFSGPVKTIGNWITKNCPQKYEMLGGGVYPAVKVNAHDMAFEFIFYNRSFTFIICSSYLGVLISNKVVRECIDRS
jgi:hypothetical protein